MNKLKHMIFMLLTVAALFTALSGNAFAYDVQLGQEEPTVSSSAWEQAEPIEVEPGLTPGGNMTLVDDIMEGTDEPAPIRQFITLQSKNGNTFYLIIDRTGDTENVYFLNLVDEADLMALTGDEVAKPVVNCTCTDKCKVGSIDTACELCRVNLSECIGKEPVPVQPTEPTQESTTEQQPTVKPEQSKSSGVLATVVLIALGAGGALYFFKLRKSKSDTSGEDDLEDYDYGQEEPDDEPDDPDDEE